MSLLTDYLYKENEKIKRNSSDCTKVLTLKDVDDVVKFYKTIYKELEDANCKKFLHKLKSEELENIIKSDSTAILGYFKEGKHLTGALITRPFEKNSKFFQTPSFEKQKTTTYALGGLAVLPQFRGNGIVRQMADVMVNGVKDYAINSGDKNDICGVGFDISCENFGSLLSLGCLKNKNKENVFNFLGVHYLANPREKDNDLTLLGYSSFDKSPIVAEKTKKAVLNSNLEDSLFNLQATMQGLNQDIKTSLIDGHIIENFNENIKAEFKDVLEYDPQFTKTYPPQLNL